MFDQRLEASAAGQTLSRVTLHVVRSCVLTLFFIYLLNSSHWSPGSCVRMSCHCLLAVFHSFFLSPSFMWNVVVMVSPSLRQTRASEGRTIFGKGGGGYTEL